MTFQPTDLSGLQSWVKADIGAYSDVAMTTPATADGTEIKGWVDQSGQGNHFLDSGVGIATGPALKLAIQNGLPVLRFDGAGNVLRCAGLGAMFRGTQPFTMFFLAAIRTVTSGVLASWSTNTEAGDDGIFRARTSAFSPHGQELNRTITDAGTVGETVDLVDTGGGFSNMAVSYDGAGNTHVYTLGNEGTAGSSGANVSTINQFMIGALVRAGNDNGVLFCPADVGEFFIYNRLLNSTEIGQCNDYLSARWGLSAPATPVITCASFWDGVNVTWPAVPGASTYDVQRSAVSAGVWTTIASPSLPAYYDHGFTGGFDYRVRGVNISFGPGSYSTVATGSTGGSPTPLNLAPCVRWGKVDGLGLSDGDPISSYTDLSGLNLHFTQTGSNRPVYKAGIQNGLGMALFSAASSQYMICDALAAYMSGTNIPRTIVLMLKHRSIGTVIQCPWMVAASTAQGQTNDYLLEPNTNGWDTAIRNDSANAEIIMGAGDADTAAHVHAFVFDGTTLSLYIDGTLCNSGPFAVGQLTNDVFTYGAHRRQSTLDAFLDGYIGEDLVYSGALNGAEVAQLSSYLSARWATPSSAPFMPSQIPGIIGHFRDDSIPAVANGAAASSWFNRTNGGIFGGNSTFFDLSAVGAVVRTDNAINGRSAVSLAGGYLSSTDNLLPPYLSGTAQPFSIAAVVKADAVASLQELFSLGNSGSSAAHSVRITAAPAWAAKEINDAAAAATISGGAPDTSAHAVLYTFDGTTGNVYVDGALKATGAMAGGASTFNRLAVGVLLGASASNQLAGKVGEVGLWMRAISGVERGQLFAYLAARWGTPSAAQRRRSGNPRTATRTISSRVGSI